jgi:hypothetical protein
MSPDPIANTGTGQELQWIRMIRTGSAHPDEWRVVSERGYETAGHDGEYGVGYQVWNGADSRLLGRRTLDTLEVEGQVVNVSDKVSKDQGGDDTNVNRPIDMNDRVSAVAKMVRCFRIRAGIVARSPSRIWMAMKMITSRKNPSIHPHTLFSDHGYCRPPHCKDSKRQTMALMRNPAPTTSISISFCFSEISVKLLLGLLKKKNTVSTAIAPNGRLIWSAVRREPSSLEPHTQKHHLHVSLSVNAPPRIGPTMLDTPNMLEMAAM